METISSSLTPLGFFERLRAGAACAVAWLLLGTVGWQMAKPLDPQMAVTLTASGRAILATGPALLVLAVVAAAIGTAIIGRRLPEAGALCAAVGLAGMSLRGGSMQVMLAYYADQSTQLDQITQHRRGLMIAMLADALLWAAILVTAWMSMLIVRRWLWPELVAAETPPSDPKSAIPSAFVRGWPALAVTAVVATIVIWLTIARTPVASIARGQIIASVGGGLFLGAMAARYFTGNNDSVWYALAVPVVAVIGYVLGHFSADMSWAEGPFLPFASLATTPPHLLARPLPIEYIAVGLIGALTGFWTGQRMEHVVEHELT